ncbi:hypothetical protein MHYMCMPSP_01101 [Hyalomma marginatum]|uniref:Uncharacterized protein n=1 Tax=Hyalomma marginatum TaxID=34627 RepID=A0A8S4BY63_9ACAR|nr:hypothetical protein MHYMCMPSP_01101 [Hyalomma marginatum]CAG7599326.1 hypothetical protein MHYMCMPASI_01089 [Hyalomma marginatum]
MQGVLRHLMPYLIIVALYISMKPLFFSSQVGTVLHVLDRLLGTSQRRYRFLWKLIDTMIVVDLHTKDY